MAVRREKQQAGYAAKRSSASATKRAGQDTRYVKGVRSAVCFYKRTVKRPDIRAIMEDLSKL